MSLGLDEIFVIVTIFNPPIEADTFRLRGCQTKLKLVSKSLKPVSNIGHQLCDLKISG